MPNSLRARIKQLRYKGKITQQEYDEIIKKLDGHDREVLTDYLDKVTDLLTDEMVRKKAEIEKKKQALVPSIEDMDMARGYALGLRAAERYMLQVKRGYFNEQEAISYTSKNGYTGILYGKSSLSIKKGDKEVMHTGFRNINTYEELVECVETYPEFTKKLADVWQDIYNDDDED